MILVISPKNVYAAKRLLEEAAVLDMPLQVLPPEEAIKEDFDISKYTCLYVRSPYINKEASALPQIIALAKKFKAAGKKVVDSVIANGELGQGKWLDYEQLKGANLLIPTTSEILGRESLPFEYPYILKWFYGFKGKGTFFIESEQDLAKIPKSIPAAELMLQEFITAEYEYKVITVGFKAVPVVLRFAIDPKTKRPDFGKYQVFTTPSAIAATPPVPGGEWAQSPPEKEEYPAQLGEVVKIAEQSSRVLKRELAKVDILQSQGKFYVLEVNRFPGLDSFEELTKYNIAGEFIEYLQSR